MFLTHFCRILNESECFYEFCFLKVLIINQYSFFTKDEIGIGYGSLRNYGLNPEHPYANGRVIIKEGLLISAKGERGKREKEQ